MSKKMHRFSILITLQIILYFEFVQSLGKDVVRPPTEICDDLYCPTYGCTPNLVNGKLKSCPCKSNCECNTDGGFVQRSLIDIGVCLIDDDKDCYEPGREPYNYFWRNLTMNGGDLDDEFFLHCLRLSELQSYSRGDNVNIWKEKIRDFEEKDWPFYKAWLAYNKDKDLKNTYCASGKCTNKKCDPAGPTNHTNSSLPQGRIISNQCTRIKTNFVGDECVTPQQYKLVKSAYKKTDNEHDQIILTDLQVKFFCYTNCCKVNTCVGREHCLDTDGQSVNYSCLLLLIIAFVIVLGQYF